MTSDTKEHGEPVLKLDSCPFCGSESAHTHTPPYGDFAVICEGCGAEGALGDTAAEAAAAWNQRPTPERPPHQGLIEEERKLIVDALMEKHIHHAQHAAKYGDQEGFQGHEPLAKRCKLLADAIMDRAIAALEVQRPSITQELREAMEEDAMQYRRRYKWRYSWVQNVSGDIVCLQYSAVDSGDPTSIENAINGVMKP